MKTVEDLDVYKKAHLFTLALYNTTTSFPTEERYGLCSQIRRAAVSINANLMEGAHRATRREYHHFASISRGSTGELKYLLLVSHDLGYVGEAEYLELLNTADEISRMLDAMMRSLEK